MLLERLSATFRCGVSEDRLPLSRVFLKHPGDMGLQREPATQHAISVFRGCQHPPSHTCCSQISQPDFFLQPPVLMMMIKYSWDAVPAYFVKFQIPFFKWKLFFFSFRWSQFWREVKRRTNASDSKTRNWTKKSSILSFHKCVQSPQHPTLRRRGKHRI